MATAGAKVTVASKLPMRLEMQCCKKRVEQRRHQGEVWQEETFHKDGPIAVIEGTAYPVGAPPPNMPPPPRMEGGYALTFGVDKDLWDQWAKEHADCAMIKNRLVFAFEKTDTVKGKAKEGGDVDSGLGPLIPDVDRRWPRKSTNPRQSRVAPESEPDYSE